MNNIIKSWYGGILTIEQSKNKQDLPDIWFVEKRCYQPTKAAYRANKDKLELRQELDMLFVARYNESKISIRQNKGKESIQKIKKGKIIGTATAYPHIIRSETIDQLLTELDNLSTYSENSIYSRVKDSEISKVVSQPKWQYLSEQYHLPKNWYEATLGGYIIRGSKSTFDRNSEVICFAALSADPRYQGLILVQNKSGETQALTVSTSLVLSLKEFYKNKDFIIGYPMASDPSKASKFWEKLGGRVICEIPNNMFDVRPSTGIFVVFDLRKKP